MRFDRHRDLDGRRIRLQFLFGTRPGLDGAPVEGEGDVLARQVADDELDLHPDMGLAAILIVFERDPTVFHHRTADADAVVETDELRRTILVRHLDVADALLRIEVMDLAVFNRRNVARADGRFRLHIRAIEVELTVWLIFHC